MGREAGVYFKWGEIRPAGIYRRSRPQVLRLGFEGVDARAFPGAAIVQVYFTDTNGTAEPGTIVVGRTPFQRSA